MSNEGGMTASPTTGAKRFNPFAPLSPAQSNQAWSASSMGNSGLSSASRSEGSTSLGSNTTSTPSTSPLSSSATSPTISTTSPITSHSDSVASHTIGGNGISAKGRNRPESLYIPMDERFSNPAGAGAVSGSGATFHSTQANEFGGDLDGLVLGNPHQSSSHSYHTPPQSQSFPKSNAPYPSDPSAWPFNRANPHHLMSPPNLEGYPLTPSAIHPSYADPGDDAPGIIPASTSHHHHSNTIQGFAASALASLSGAGQHLYSTIPVNSSPDRASARSSSPSGQPGTSRRIANANGGTPKHHASPSINAQNGSARHAQTYSLGTHALLSSRNGGNTSARLAQRFDTPTAWLVLYFGFNLGLTLFNKLVLQGFPFPWTLTAIQMLSGTIGTQIALHRGYFTQARLTTKEGAVMVAFSVLYTVNIAVSNISLQLVTVPFHQVVRAMTPLFTIIIAAITFRKRHSRDTYLSLLPVVAGVAFATYGDYSFTAWGFILTLLGTILAALKTITTNRVQVGRLKLHPLDLLIRMSPLAFVQCVAAGYLSGELDRVRVYGATQMTRHKAIALATNGAIAFGLNVVSFTANKKTSALTMTVAANVKQVLTIVLAVLIFNVSLNPTNLFGIMLTLGGGAWYAAVELKEKARNSNAAPARNSTADPEKN